MIVLQCLICQKFKQFRRRNSINLFLFIHSSTNTKAPSFAYGFFFSADFLISIIFLKYWVIGQILRYTFVKIMLK